MNHKKELPWSLWVNPGPYKDICAWVISLFDTFRGKGSSGTSKDFTSNFKQHGTVASPFWLRLHGNITISKKPMK